MFARANIKLSLATLLSLELLCAAQNVSSELPVVDIGYGLQRASAYNAELGTYSFSNIRYAAPPLGPLRFQHPQTPTINYTSIDDGHNDRICPQASANWFADAYTWAYAYLLSGTLPNITYSYERTNASAPTPRDPRETEDCLFLDVHVPESALNVISSSQKLPVIVYIHGGGYTSGNKAENSFNGWIARAKEAYNSDVIFVSVNYRLGALGWLSGPAFASAGGVPNVALYDQRFALQWVKDKIHLFGGDDNNIMVSGSSAGASSIVHHLTAFGGAVKNVFKKAFIQSPANLVTQTAAGLDADLEEFLRIVGVKTLADAHTVSSDTVILANAAQIAGAGQSSFIYGPSRDGVFVVDDPKRQLLQGNFDQSVSVLVSHDKDEALGFSPPIKTDAEFDKFVRRVFPDASPEVLEYITTELYPPVFDGSYGYIENIARASAAMTEWQFTCNAYALTSSVKRAYAYAYHTFPAVHLADTGLTIYDPTSNQTANETQAFMLQDYITGLAILGAPDSYMNNNFTVPVYHHNHELVLLNGTDIGVAQDPISSERCQWWMKALVL